MKKLIVGNFDIAESILRGYWKDRENFMVNLGARLGNISGCNKGKGERG